MEPATERKILFFFHFHFVKATKSQNNEFCDNFFSFSFRDECTQRGGSAQGECASGYGVCCVCKLKFVNSKKGLKIFYALTMSLAAHRFGQV